VIKNIYFGFWCRFTINFSDKIIAISGHDKRLFSRISNNIELIPVPVDTDNFEFHERKRSNFKMISVGRLSRNKRIDRLINVMKIVSRIEPKSKLFIVGKDIDGLQKSLEKDVAEAGIQNNIEFLGEIDDKKMLEYMKKSTFFLSSSEYESFGISAVEAMASGLIVILNDIESFRYFVKNGENGFLAEYSDENGVAELISKLNKKDLLAISKSASERVLEFKKENVAKRMESLYLEIVKNHN